jgi:adenylate kinase family enzyme
MKRTNEILFVLGPSGSGKSDFAKFLEKQNRWLRLEIDQFPKGDGIDINDLRQQWDLFYPARNAIELAKELRKRTDEAGRTRCVISFPSGLVLSPGHIAAAEEASIQVVYLYGSAAHCVNAFLERERISGRNLDFNHWLLNNRESYLAMSDPVFERYRVHVFDIDGHHRSHEDVLQDIR